MNRSVDQKWLSNETNNKQNTSGGGGNIGYPYPSEIHPSHELHKISLVLNTRFSCTVVVKFCTEHSIITAVFCTVILRDLSSRWALDGYLIPWISLQWRHNEHDGVSNRQPRLCYFAVYSGADQRKHQSSASLAFVGNSQVTGEFPAQMVSIAENIFILWRHHLALWLHSSRCIDCVKNRFDSAISRDKLYLSTLPHIFCGL